MTALQTFVMAFVMATGLTLPLGILFEFYERAMVTLYITSMVFFSLVLLAGVIRGTAGPEDINLVLNAGVMAGSLLGHSIGTEFGRTLKDEY